jgi:hypothetical protein
VRAREALTLAHIECALGAVRLFEATRVAQLTLPRRFAVRADASIHAEQSSLLDPTLRVDAVVESAPTRAANCANAPVDAVALAVAALIVELALVHAVHLLQAARFIDTFSTTAPWPHTVTHAVGLVEKLLRTVLAVRLFEGTGVTELTIPRKGAFDALA